MIFPRLPRFARNDKRERIPETSCAALLSCHTTLNGCATEQPQFTKADWSAIKQSTAKLYAVIDGRNILPAGGPIHSGFKYLGVDRRFPGMAPLMKIHVPAIILVG